MKFQTHLATVIVVSILLIFACRDSIDSKSTVWTDDIDSLLLVSILANDFASVDSLIHLNMDLNSTDKNGATPLMWACHSADSSMARLLVDNGALGPPPGGGIPYKHRGLSLIHI